MKPIFVSILLSFFVFKSFSQAKTETLSSSFFDFERELKIQLPRNYNPQSELVYPLVIVLDGDYLFEPVAGNIDYQAYWQDIPDCIIIGINQETTRKEDFTTSDDAKMNFYKFIKQEIVPYAESKYKASKFRIIVGHDLSANYAHHFLAKTHTENSTEDQDDSLFRAYVILSPTLNETLTTELKKQLLNTKKKLFYYLATGDSDLDSTKLAINNLNKSLETIQNSKLNYTFDNFNGANHYSLVGRGIPKALNKIFALYKPINKEEYKQKVLTNSASPYNYLINKYETIESFYGFKKKYTENDIRAIMSASIKRDDLESIENLVNLVKEEFKESMLSNYYLGLLSEKKGNLTKALLYYKSSLSLKPSQFIDKELMLEKIYSTKKKLGN